jgi:large subunit ribosomal protein L17
MRHNKKFNHLSRTAAHRKSMLANMSISLIKHKRIQTTVAKAKALRVYIEPILTKSKEDTTASRRYVFSRLQNKEAVTELFQNISQKIADRPGGYTRILRTGLRLGDSAEMCIIELVDYNENMLKDKVAKKTVRTRRSSSRKTTATPVATPAKEEAAEAAIEEKVETPAVEEKKAVAEEPEAVQPEKAKEEAPEAETPKAAETEAKKDVKKDTAVKEEAVKAPEEKAEAPAAEKKPAAKAEKEEKPAAKAPVEEKAVPQAETKAKKEKEDKDEKKAE